MYSLEHLEKTGIAAIRGCRDLFDGNVVFTNGCFDILHPGHFSLLRYCRERAQGGFVVVGLNSDDSVRRLKGPSRPFFSEIERWAALKDLKTVDFVIPFDEDTPYRIIEQIRPNIIVKGGDYRAEDVIGADLAEVEIFPYVSGFSTTEIIERIKNL